MSIRGLTTEFVTAAGTLRAADDVSYDVHPGEVLGVVGESGSGKSVTVLSALGLIPQPPARITAGEVIVDGRDLLTLPKKELRKVRGGSIGMIFQDPMASLNPVLTVGQQIIETIAAHNPSTSRKASRARAADLLALVGVPDPKDRLRQYPHEFSGGMRQRAMIAIAIANGPSVIVADEPTTALDVTIQAQVLDVLETSRKETGAATILITHDLGLLAQMADRVVVMYAGRVVETGTVDEIFNAPRHPYTVGLLGSLPTIDGDITRLSSIQGSPPNLSQLPSGCAFHPRCALGHDRPACRTDRPALMSMEGDHRSACHYVDEVAGFASTVGVA